MFEERCGIKRETITVVSIIFINLVIHCHRLALRSCVFSTGTGGSTFNANLWLLDSQLPWLSNNLSSWSKIDDLWVSFVMDAFLGWEMRCLAPEIVPVNIGDFLKNRSYQKILFRQISPNTKDALAGVHLQKDQKVGRVATLRDSTVDKHDMFCMLQRSFFWNVDVQEHVTCTKTGTYSN